MVVVLFAAFVLGGAGYFGVQQIVSHQTTVPIENSKTDFKVAASTTDQTVRIDDLKKTRENTSTSSILKSSSVAPSQESAVPPTTTVSNQPTITSFVVTPSIAYTGDSVTFSWTSENVVSCAVPVTHPSELAIPFTGRLPQGTTNYKLEADGPQNITYWIVCADKDWNTINTKTNLQYSAPHIVGTPYAANDEGQKQISITFRGATTAHLTCVNNFILPSIFKVFDGIIVADGVSYIATAKLDPNLPAGLSLGCSAEFGSSGIKANFTVTSPS